MKAAVIRAFIDKETKKPYNAGSVYESDNIERIKELQEKGYLLNKEYNIKEYNIKEYNIQYPLHLGGGWYELSNGEKIKGKKEAIQAQKELE